ncbi:Protein PHYTOCHROME KINASE SUBSTRATE 1 [Linum perenne]
MAALPSTGNFKETLTSANTKNNEVSFSSYLEKPVLRKDENEDAEIGIFSAEKYFNGGIDEAMTPSRIPSRKLQEEKKKKDCRNDDGNKVAVKTSKIFHSSGITPSLKSESSWNSHSILLKSTFRNNKARSKSLISGLTCRCYCSDKKSVDVKEEEQIGDISFRGNRIPGKLPNAEQISAYSEILKTKKETCFSFPTTPSSEAHEPKLFPRSVNLKDIRKLPARKQEEPEDCESDASSDLFEIESLTGNKVTSFLARQNSGATSGCITPIYPPSEASVDWSVVTAKTTDFYTDHEGFGARSPRRRLGGGSMFGCKTVAAVSPSATKAETRTRNLRASDSFPRPGSRSQPERKLSGFDSRHRHSSLVNIHDHKLHR